MFFHKITSLNYIAREFFSAAGAFGHPVFYLTALLILVKFQPMFAVILLLSMAFIELICALIKLVYRKERPNPRQRKGFLENIDANSFPSVHSARVALAAIMIALYYRDFWVSAIGIFIALSVGYSRIYLKSHYLIDVAAGFFIGALTAVVAAKITGLA